MQKGINLAIERAKWHAHTRKKCSHHGSALLLNGSVVLVGHNTREVHAEIYLLHWRGAIENGYCLKGE
jgi:hypothetical protein